MKSKSGLSVLVLAVGIVAGGAVPALAHGPGQSGEGQPFGCHQGWHMGPTMGQGQTPTMGQDQMPTMGQDQMPMMGQDQMPMMGQGMSPGMMQALAKDLSAADVQHMMEHRLAWQGYPNLKVGKVEEKDDHTVVAEIVTKEGLLVQRLEVDRHRGSMRPVQ
jgi:hypothetical protein